MASRAGLESWEILSPSRCKPKTGGEYWVELRQAFLSMLSANPQSRTIVLTCDIACCRLGSKSLPIPSRCATPLLQLISMALTIGGQGISVELCLVFSEFQSLSSWSSSEYNSSFIWEVAHGTFVRQDFWYRCSWRSLERRLPLIIGTRYSSTGNSSGT